MISLRNPSTQKVLRLCVEGPKSLVPRPCSIPKQSLINHQPQLQLQVEQKRFYTSRNILWLRPRGLISAFFPAEDEKQFGDHCNAKPITVYAGFDPTAESLHVGNLAVIMMLLHCQRSGHHAIALIGGATGRIGDPSGRKSDRPELDSGIVKDNVEKLRNNLKTVFQNHERIFWDDLKGKEPLAKPLIVDNYEWYKKLSALEFVGKIGRHFRLGMMLSKDAVKSRLTSPAEEGISFTEFTYQIFQSYDWYYLLKHYECHVQVGGHDQMGNIHAGHEFISRTLRQPVYGITVPLITTETGAKYGKSAGNAIWLDPELTGPFDFYQFFIRTRDTDVERLLGLFTFRTEQEITALVKRHQKSPEERIAQKELAKDVTLLVHGEEGLATALKATEALYSENLEALATLKANELQCIFKNAGGGSYLSELLLSPGTTILEMAMKARCFDNERDAIRIIQAGGFYLNYRKISNIQEVIVPGIHILQNHISLARVGKKNYYVIKWSP